MDNMKSARAQLEFDYTAQGEWPDNCNEEDAMRQSPINIVTENVDEDADDDVLIPLEFDDVWTATLTGQFSNNGLGVRFVADGADKARVSNHLGTYELLNFHMHWASGHEIDGKEFGVELHFVTAKLGADLTTLDNTTEDATITVISVLAEADDSMAISGTVWELLDASRVTNASDSISVTGLSYPMVLPESKSYYYYMGSQTSPPCEEFVHFFVMKDTIPIPSTYLEQLRTVRFDSGELILSNHRDAQPLNGRTVLLHNGAAQNIEQATGLIVLLILAYIL